MKLSHLALVVVLSAATAFGVTKYAAPTTTTATESPAKETAFERVMKTNTLRCGYYVFPPVVMRDPNTGKMSGFTVDMMEAIAAKTGLKIEWTEESTFGNWIPALQSNRYDAMCAPMWSDMALGRETIYTRPLFYAGMYPLVRADDTRFDGPEALDKMNSPDVTILGQDGNSILFLAKEAFPKAKFFTVAAQVDGPSVIQNIMTGKADVVLLDRNGLAEYNKHGLNLKLIELPRPIKAQPFVLPVNRKETELREFLDNAVHDLLVSGTMDRLLTKWESEPGKTFLRVAPPFESATK
ncbi:MAG TPA: hypothetical protein DCY07_04810 [Rhodospirillaceae bacterium]|nr:hypothetical protein [Rhodospirillaceae bacterium]